MKKIDPGQTITIFANIGVIAGIGLLAIELNQNNALLRNEARYNLHLARTGEIEQFALNERLGDIWAKARDGEPLTAEEMRVISSLALGSVHGGESRSVRGVNGLQSAVVFCFV
jgi:hypothetical protein